MLVDLNAVAKKMVAGGMEAKDVLDFMFTAEPAHEPSALERVTAKLTKANLAYAERNLRRAQARASELTGK